MKFCVLATSLKPDSKSRVLAKRAVQMIKDQGEPVDYVNLANMELPPCDATYCYSNENAVVLREKLINAKGILVALPVYNYSVSSVAKNAIELTGRDAWTGKVAGFLCAAGGMGSYMSVMSLANSLMLDFHTTILPWFVYAQVADFEGEKIANPDIEERLDRVVKELVRYTNLLVEE